VPLASSVVHGQQQPARSAPPPLILSFLLVTPGFTNPSVTVLPRYQEVRIPCQPCLGSRRSSSPSILSLVPARSPRFRTPLILCPFAAVVKADCSPWLTVSDTSDLLISLRPLYTTSAEDTSHVMSASPDPAVTHLQHAADGGTTGATSDAPLNGNSLPTRNGPKLFSNGEDGSASGAGTPIGFQRYPQNKILDNARSPARHPSPQPTHLGIPGGGQHRVLTEEDPGYVAAKFEGKQKQMEQGELSTSCPVRAVEI